MGKNYFQTIKDGILVDGSGGGDAPAPVLIAKSVIENGSYSASDDSADGYSTVSVDVPNSYSAGDEGKVVSNGSLVSQGSDTATQNGEYDTTLIDSLTVDVEGGEATLITKSITVNGTYAASSDSADGYSSVTVAVENSYTAQDEGKVVSSGALVAQSTHKQISANGIGIDTTNYSSVDVAVPNTYAAVDEGKVVSSGALVSQTTDSTTTNGTVDTTTISSLTVNVPNTYTSADEGKVVSNGALVSQSSSSTSTNGTVDTTTISSLSVAVEPDLTTKSISANGTYSASDDNADGYSSVVVDVPSDTISAIVTVLVEHGAVVTATGTEGTYTETAGLNDTAVLKIKRHGSYTVSATKNGVTSNTESLTIPEYGGQYTKTLSFITLTVTIPSGSTYTITDGTTTITGTSTGSAVTHYLPNTGTWTVSCTDVEHSASDTVSVSEYIPYSIELTYSVAHIYGVSWDKSSSSILTRTDDAANFSDPDPYVNDGVHSGSSPFDTLMPWAGMVQETINENVLVKIPKFWYKITNTNNELKFQIADAPVDGFFVSPAHADRGDNNGERDYVYIARYKCSGTAYKSKTGNAPKVSITRDAARTAIKALGTGFYQQDFAMFWTIRMLYLVEYANWNSQAAIGYGCGNDNRTQNLGASDSMTYHTGTMQSARTTYGVGVQYRWIEDPWGNAREWCDGIYFSGSNVYCINNPANFSDRTGGTKIGTRPTTSGYISDWSIPTATGFEYALYPSAVSGGEQTYIADSCYYSNSGAVLNVGGNYSQSQSHGMFNLTGSYVISDQNTGTGARLMYLPS